MDPGCPSISLTSTIPNKPYGFFARKASLNQTNRLGHTDPVSARHLQHRAPTLLSHPKVTRLTQSTPSRELVQMGAGYRHNQNFNFPPTAICPTGTFGPVFASAKNVDNKITLVWEQCKTLMNTDVRGTRRE